MKKKVGLTHKMLIAIGSVLIVLFICLLGIFWTGQKKLTTQEMDRLLKKEAFTFASLVNLSRRGEIDFEFTSDFLPNYEKLNQSAFFRYYLISNDQLLMESPHSPEVPCDLKEIFRSVKIQDRTYRVHSYRFQVVAEIGQTIPAGTIEPYLCVVIGNDEAPYREAAVNTISFILPLVLAIFLIALFLLNYILKSMTADLSNLAKVLESSDFHRNRVFPDLPEAQTREVHAIVETLTSVHAEAMEVYKEMILFIGRAAHQLKTPLAAIQATYEVLIRRERTHEELIAGLADISIGVKQMTRLTSKLISSTRLNFNTHPEFKKVALKEFFDQLWRIHQYQAGVKSITILLQGGEDVEVWADDYLLTEIFGNLIDNAILYCPEDSTLRIRWDIVESFTVIRIQDNGPGIPHEVQANIFEPFVRGDERTIQGSGLGLSIVHSAVQSMGGSVQLESSSDKGTTVVVSLATNPSLTKSPS